VEQGDKQIKGNRNVKGRYDNVEKPHGQKFHSLNIVGDQINDVAFPEFLQCMMSNQANLNVEKEKKN